MLKSLSLLTYLICCLDVLVMQKTGLIRKLRLISKFMRPQFEQQINTMHILLNISRAKGNRKMKLSQLIEYKVLATFFYLI